MVLLTLIPRAITVEFLTVKYRRNYEPMRTFYSVLCCEETLGQKDLKDKYFALIRSVHPDRNPDEDLGTFTVAHKAWSVLR